MAPTEYCYRHGNKYAFLPRWTEKLCVVVHGIWDATEKFSAVKKMISRFHCLKNSRGPPYALAIWSAQSLLLQMYLYVHS